MFQQAMLDLVTKKQSGVLYLKTKDNHSASIHLKAGDIIGISYRVRRGLKAIDLIRTADIDSFRFDPSGILVDTHGLPTTRQIIQALLGDMLGGGERPVVENRPASKEKRRILPGRKAKPINEPAPSRPVVLSTSSVADVEELLLQFLTYELKRLCGGEIATVHQAMVKNEAMQGRSELIQTIQAIAATVDDPQQGALFKGKMTPWADLVTGPRAMTVVRKAFTEFLGPMAELICSDHVNRLGGRVNSLEQLAKLVEQLSKELQDSVETGRFIKLCYTTLFSFK